MYKENLKVNDQVLYLDIDDNLSKDEIDKIIVLQNSILKDIDMNGGYEFSELDKLSKYVRNNKMDEMPSAEIVVSEKSRLMHKMLSYLQESLAEDEDKNSRDILWNVYRHCVVKLGELFVCLNVDICYKFSMGKDVNYIENMKSDLYKINGYIYKASKGILTYELSFSDSSNDVMKAEMYSLLNRYIVSVGSFLPVTKKACSLLGNYLKDKKVLEIMSGSGMLAKGLQDYGVDIIATDNFCMTNTYKNYLNTFTIVENLDMIQAIGEYKDNIDTVLMCWSPYDDERDLLVLEKLKSLKKKINLVVIYADCTNSSKFKEQLQTLVSKNIMLFTKEINKCLSTRVYVGIIRFK